MATRAERMQQRIRGAGHGQVEEVSFQLMLSDETTSTVAPTSPENPPAPTPPVQATRSTPNTSAKRKRLGTSSERQDDRSKASTEKLAITAREEPADATPVPRIATPEATAPVDELDGPVSQQPERISSAGLRASRTSTRREEIEESPATAPATSKRHNGTAEVILSSGIKLQQILDTVVDDDADADPLSSPLVERLRRTSGSITRKTRTPSKRRSPLSAGSEAAQADARSPEISSPQLGTSPIVQSGPSPELSSRILPEEEVETQPAVVEEEEQHNEEDNLAKEVSNQEAAKRLGGKRSRRLVRDPSPESATAVEQDKHIEEVSPEEPVLKRRRTTVKASPAKQRQGRKKKISVTSTSEPAKAQPKITAKARQPKAVDSPDEGVFEIPVQRFTKRGRPAEGEDPDFDLISADIPFSKRSGVNTIDVLAQMCDELIQTSLNTLRDGVQRAPDASAKKELRIKTRALEAFQAELEHRFLGHTIQVDHMHALRGRIRREQAEKTSLRDEIMRLRAEREQVAVRKEAVRSKHEKARSEALHQLGTSTAMHDIDLAVERGRGADDLSPAAEKKANLANLELLISRITDQACTKSDVGGTARQLRDFNAFLERAALALENR
ncbi:hypothetical protein D7B24_005723 [Verticillium nonalfalfae]|uniref:Inner kinetochore subunit AME1 domain-containing protein n=1 Tax=Verticillium nonalfalfae TaxID=1051616 RepID=A0A3M9YBH5_9PEZI|nr:uncharacterized protein D7B24_005723 [Verticillium nonalfalfae]RNJ57641.1 hypothetical protein D7B24_005723 [Verticillium nonalfalfae]